MDRWLINPPKVLPSSMTMVTAMKHHIVLYCTVLYINAWVSTDAIISLVAVLLMYCTWTSVAGALWISGLSAQNRWPRGAEGSAGWQLSHWRHANLPENARHFKCADILDKEEVDCLGALACVVYVCWKFWAECPYFLHTRIYLTISVSRLTKLWYFRAC